MDSPEPTPRITTASTTATDATIATCISSDSPPVQESPFSNYVSNLSPIKPVKAAHVAQAFLGLNSPPLVFTSPRVISDREIGFLHRSQCSGTSGAEISKNNDESMKIAAHSDDLEKSISYLSSRSITDAQKDSNAENSTQDQPGSSSGCVDEYLSEPVEADCANSLNLVNQNVEQTDDLHQRSVTGLTNPEKITIKSDDKNVMRIKEDSSQALPEPAEGDPQKHSAHGINPPNIEGDQICGKKLSNDPNFESDLPIYHAARKERSETLGAQAHEDYREDVGAVLHGPVQSAEQHDPEGSQLQCGKRRRCLQFEEAQWKTNMDSDHSPNVTNNATGSSTPAFSKEMKCLDSSTVDLSLSNKKQIMTAMLPSHNSGKSPLAASRPSGFGLHLNSVVNTLPAGNATASRKTVMSCHVVNKNSCSKLSNLVEKISITTEDRVLEPEVSLATYSATSESFHTMEPLSMLPQFEQQITPHNKRKFHQELANNFEEFSQSSPPKRRKKPSGNDVDGCKRCNCKKTKCLKLYCDCFAAGIYCAQPCACQGCLNRPEYEDTVLDTRQSIENRNPLAFAPKIVQHISEFPVIDGEDGSRYTPSSARHKRGCNCKRSMCLKKYCECYQANVGCSSGCRCEGCKNVYGRKEEYCMTEEIVSNRALGEQLESRVDDKIKTEVTGKNFLHGELYDLHNLTPSTPSFEYTGHGKDAPKSRLVSRTYVPSPESDFSMLPSYEKFARSPRNSHGSDLLPERSKETFDAVSYDQGIDCSIAEVMDQFSPKCNALSDKSDFTPLPNPSSVTMASSASSKTREWKNVSRLQLWLGSDGVSPGGSLRWRSSPSTPTTTLVESKNQAHDSDCLYDIMEDDTPEILKEEASPTASVKVSSPNKKRVSPPHSQMRQLGSSSSGGLKSGRKFILRAVPSFPPLTPSIETKDSTNRKS